MKSERRLGIIGGLGPETSCKFCLNVNNKFRELTNKQPDILLENLPISKKAERKLINGEPTSEHFNLLMESVKRMNQANVDFIVIPCNTVHIFINKLRRISKKPILSIVEEIIKECKKRNIKKTGLLASTNTVKKNLHINELKKIGIKTVLPNKADQERISKIIIKIIHNKVKKEDKKFLINIIKNFKKQRAEAVILGCTDLPLLISEKDSSLPLIDTGKVLENSTVRKLSDFQVFGGKNES